MLYLKLIIKHCHNNIYILQLYYCYYVCLKFKQNQTRFEFLGKGKNCILSIHQTLYLVNLLKLNSGHLKNK